MILEELPTELLPSLFRHIPCYFLWTNVRPVCRRLNNYIRRNEYWLRRLSELYGLQLAPRLRTCPPLTAEAEQQQYHQHISEGEGTANADFEQLMPALRCMAVEFRAVGGSPFSKRIDDAVAISTIDALRLFRHSDGRIFCLTGARDREITLRTFDCNDELSINEGHPIARVENAHKGWIWSISTTSDGRQFYSAGWDACIQQWHLAESRIERGISLNLPKVAALCCVAEGPNVLYASTYRRGPILFDLRIGKEPQHEMNMHNNFPVLELATGSTSNQLFSIGEDDRLVSVDKRNFSGLLCEHRAPVSHVDYADGQLCLSLKNNGQLRFFDPNTLQMENQLTVTDTGGHGPSNVIRLTRGATFCANSDNTLRMFTAGLHPRLVASTKLNSNVTRLDALNNVVVAALGTGTLAYFQRGIH